MSGTIIGSFPSILSYICDTVYQKGLSVYFCPRLFLYLSSGVVNPNISGSHRITDLLYQRENLVWYSSQNVSS